MTYAIIADGIILGIGDTPESATADAIEPGDCVPCTPRLKASVLAAGWRVGYAMIDGVADLAAWTPDDLRAWRLRMGLSRQQAATVLGISAHTLLNYETGCRRDKARTPAPIPRAVQLACERLESLVTPQR